MMDTFDNRWEEVHKEKDWGKYPPEEIIRFVARNYYNKNRPETKILDIGCGTGSITWYLAREGFSTFALDGSETAVVKARKRIFDERLKADIIVCDAGSVPYQDEYFDAIIDSALICCNTSKGIKTILKECYRILKAGGKIFSTGLFKVGMTGYGTGQRIEENTYREVLEGNVAHIGTVHFFDERQISDFWTSSGFSDIKIDSLDRTDLGGKARVSYYMAEAVKS